MTMLHLVFRGHGFQKQIQPKSLKAAVAVLKRIGSQKRAGDREQTADAASGEQSPDREATTKLTMLIPVFIAVGLMLNDVVAG